MNNHSNAEKNRLIEALIRSSGGKIDANAANKAMQGDMSDAISSLDEDSRKKFMDMISDKQKLDKLLSSDAAQKLRQILLGGENKNG